MLIPERDLDYMRNNRQWAEFYLAVEQPPVIAVMLVDDATITTAETDIVFDDGDFDETAFVYFTVEVYDGDTGIHKGTTRLRDTEAPVAAGTLNVAANSIAWEDDDRIEIKRQIRPWAVNPNLENTQEDLDNAYTNESTSPYPLAHIGPPACIFLDDTYDISGDHGEVRWWSDDECINAGAALASYDWTFLTGHPITPTNVAGTADDPVVVHHYETGQHYLYHTVTDSVGKAHTRHSHTYVFDDPSAPSLTGNYPIREFSIENLSGDLEGGTWRGTVRVWEDADESQFPELSEVVVFSRQHWYDMSADCDVEVDVGYGWEHRENILFVGYIVKDSVRKDPHTGDVTFEIASITEIMKSMTCWGAGFRDTGTADWHVFPTAPNELTLNLAAHHVFREHTTISFIADVYLKLNDADDDSIRMDSIDFQESDPYDQIKVQIGEAGRAVLCANKFGQIFLEPNLQLQKLSVRAAADLSATSLQHGDWRDEINLGDEPSTKEVCQVDFIGFTEDLTPYYSLAPYRQYSTGRVQKTTGVRVADQTEANVYGGLFEGWYNGEFKSVSMPMRGFWPVFDVIPQRYVGLTLDEDDTNRGLVWNDTRHIVKQISVSINAEGPYALTDLVLEQESYGLPGLTNIVPDEPTPPDPDPPTPPLPPPPIEYNGRLRRAILHTTQGIFITKNFHLPNPTWEASNNNLGANERTTVRGVAFDFSDGDRAFMVSDHTVDNGVFRCNDIWDQAAWSRQFDGAYVKAIIQAALDGICNTPTFAAATIGYVDIDCDPTDGSIVIVAGATGPPGAQSCRYHKRAFYSTDALATLPLGDGLWHDPCPGDCGHPSTPQARGVTITGGTALLTYICAWGVGSDFHRGISTDGGVTVDTTAGQVAPWAAGANAGHTRVGNIVIFWYGNNAFFSNDAGTTFDTQVNILPANASTSLQTLSLHFLDTGNVMMANGGPWYSTDGGWTWGACGAAVANAYCCKACADPTFIPDGAGFIVGCSAPALDSWLYLTSSLGAAWINKSGNLEDFLTNGVDTIYGITPVQDS